VPVEAALYFCCMEAVQNAAKHSGAESVAVQYCEDQGQWRLIIIDNGAGFDPGQALASGTGAGLVNMRDRLDAVGGTVTVESGPGIGTTITAVVPMPEDSVSWRTLIPKPSPVG
jgi:signal transduction histidine kinase